jgi:hypothetical protein
MTDPETGKNNETEEHAKAPDKEEEGGSSTAVEKTGPDAAAQEAGEKASRTAGDEEPSKPHPYEAILEEYPLREASEDPVWSVRVVKGWMWFLAICGGGIILLTVLGFFFD